MTNPVYYLLLRNSKGYGCGRELLDYKQVLRFMHERIADDVHCACLSA